MFFNFIWSTLTNTNDKIIWSTSKYTVPIILHSKYVVSKIRKYAGTFCYQGIWKVYLFCVVIIWEITNLFCKTQFFFRKGITAWNVGWRHEVSHIFFKGEFLCKPVISLIGLSFCKFHFRPRYLIMGFKVKVWILIIIQIYSCWSILSNCLTMETKQYS